MVAASARARAILLGRTLGWVAAACLGCALLFAAARAAGHGLAGWSVAVVALTLGALLGYAALAFLRLRPPAPVTAPLAVADAPELYRIVRELAEQLGVPTPDAIELSPDCDSWLDQRPAASPARRWPPPWPPGHRRPARRSVLVIGSPFLWWLRLGELRALLAPVIAGTAAAADPRVQRARAVAQRMESAKSDPVLRRLLGAPARACARWARELEHDVAVDAATRAATLDPSGRAAAHEQVQLAYVGWDRLLTRLATPAWRIGIRPIALNAALAAALAELSRRDRLAGGFGGRLDERPACDVLDEPGVVDARLSRLAADLFWDAAGLRDQAASRSSLDAASPRLRARADAPASREVDWAQYVALVVEPARRGQAAALADAARRRLAPGRSASDAGPVSLRDVLGLLRAGEAPRLAADLATRVARPPAVGPGFGHSAGLPELPDMAEGAAVGAEPPTPTRPSRQQRSDLLVDHLLAFVECAVVDMTKARWAVDWLDGPVLSIPGDRAGAADRPASDGESGASLAEAVRPVQDADPLTLVAATVESGDDASLRQWLAALRVALDKPVEVGQPPPAGAAPSG